MSRLILYMAMSLDGFITGPGDEPGNPAGVGGMRLMEWLGKGGPAVADWRPADPQSQVKLGRHGLAGRADLPVHGKPS